MKTVVRPSPALVTFLALLPLVLSHPQRQHLLRVADALITCPRRKTLAQLHAQHLDAPDVSNLADFFRLSPWAADDLRRPLRDFALQDLLGRRGRRRKRLFLSIDDSTARKDKGCTALQAVDWLYDHSQQRHCQGAVQVSLRLHVGPYSYPLTWRLYLRRQTVRRLNRQRSGDRRVRFHSKYQLAQQMLREIAPLLPKDYQVYVLFDSWYASARLIRFIRRQGWHVICALKSNRKLSGTSVTDWDRRCKGERYLHVEVPTSDGRPRRYLVRRLWGQLEELAERVCVFISRRHHRDRHPRYFLSTDRKLSARTVLTWYGQRWSQEVDNWYRKELLGLGDFRVQSLEAEEKWYAVVELVLVFLYWHSYQDQEGPPRGGVAAVAARLRQEHACAVLEAACQEALATGDIAGVLRRYVHSPPARGQAS